MVYRPIIKSLDGSSSLKPYPHVYISLRRRLGRTTSRKAIGSFTRGSCCSYCGVHWLTSDPAEIPFRAGSRRPSVYLIYILNTLFFSCTIMAAVDYVKKYRFVYLFSLETKQKKDLMDFLVL